MKYTIEEITEKERLKLETKNPVYDTTELQETFIVHSFLAPCVFVTRKSDGVKGTLMFRSRPRFYFSFVEDSK